MALSFGKKLITIGKLFREPKTLSALISLRAFGYLFDTGWFNSFKLKEPVDENLNPIPWVTYPFLEFITDRLNTDITIFEFGSGNSTLFFAKRVNHVISIEHNVEWFNNLKEKIPPNVELIFSESEDADEYVSISRKKSKSDFVFIDGINRVECCMVAPDVLSDSGVIVLDDSERPEYEKGIKYLADCGFKKIDFWGISPGILFRKCTTVFYKSPNCLEI